jgi:TRAP-type mannitol/chloroaromatic compound transport system permease large subunit
MNATLKRTIAAADLLLIFPAALFMTALFVRNLTPKQLEPAHTAQRIVEWYSARVHLGLWLLLMTLPFIVFVTGCGTLLSSWMSDENLRQSVKQTFAAIRAHLATLLIAVTTLAAGFILACIGLHVLAD